MRVVMVSKPFVAPAYQRKLEVLAEQPDIDLTLVVPHAWDGQPYEPGFVQGYRTLVQPIRFDGNFHLFHFPKLARVLKELRPDIVHVDEEPYNLATFLAIRQALAAGARPLFFTWQNLLRRYPPPFSWMERYAYSRCAVAIAGNAEAAEVLRQKGYAGQTPVIPQFGVDPELFSPVPREACATAVHHRVRRAADAGEGDRRAVAGGGAAVGRVAAAHGRKRAAARHNPAARGRAWHRCASHR